MPPFNTEEDIQNTKLARFSNKRETQAASRYPPVSHLPNDIGLLLPLRGCDWGKKSFPTRPYDASALAFPDFPSPLCYLIQETASYPDASQCQNAGALQATSASPVK